MTLDAKPHVEALSPHHDRSAFSCGEQSLDLYLQRQATQDVKRRIARVFVALGDTPNQIVGYYALSATSFARDGLPPDRAKRLPRYPVPAVLLGRLAVDKAWQGRKLGRFLLLDALARVLSASDIVAVYALVVDDKNERAKSFYEAFGFIPFQDNARRLHMPLDSVVGIMRD